MKVSMRLMQYYVYETKKRWFRKPTKTLVASTVKLDHARLILKDILTGYICDDTGYKFIEKGSGFVR